MKAISAIGRARTDIENPEPSVGLGRITTVSDVPSRFGEGWATLQSTASFKLEGAWLRTAQNLRPSLAHVLFSLGGSRTFNTSEAAIRVELEQKISCPRTRDFHTVQDLNLPNRIEEGSASIWSTLIRALEEPLSPCNASTCRELRKPRTGREFKTPRAQPASWNHVLASLSLLLP